MYFFYPYVHVSEGNFHGYLNCLSIVHWMLMFQVTWGVGVMGWGWWWVVGGGGVGGGGGWVGVGWGGHFRNAYELLNPRALIISMLYKKHIFRCMG